MTQPRRNGRAAASRALDLTIWGISDTEILGIVDDLADEDGWTMTIDIRLQLGENVEDTGRRSGVPTRLAWLRRYGWLERNLDDGRYRLTAIGHELLDHPDLTKAVERALGNLNAAQRLRLTRELAEHGGGAQPELRNAYRRQWMRSLGR